MDINVREYLTNIIEDKGLNIPPFTPQLGEYIRGFRADRLSIIGAYTGVGKSYFVINVLDFILRSAYKTRVLVVSTEMSVDDYESRLVLMRAGLYENDLYNITSDSKKALFRSLESYEKSKLDNKNNITIIYENTWEKIAEHCKKNKYDLIILDYVQDISVNGLYRQEDTMPILAKKIEEIKTNAHVFCISQINNKHAEGNLFTLPFAYGLELSRKASHGIVLSRVKEKKGDEFSSRYTPYMVVNVMKNRGGKLGKFVMKVDRGHLYRQLDTREVLEFQNIKDSLSITI